MKLKSSFILAVIAISVLGCATVGPVANDSQTMAEQTLMRYYLEDIYDYDSISLITQNETPFFLTEPVSSQTLASGIQYYLEDIYDYDDAFFVTQPVMRQTLASGTQYYLGDIYDYDEAFLITQPVVQTEDFQNIADYFAILSIVDETPSSTTEPALGQTLASETQYYLEDIYDYDERYIITKIPERN